MTFLDSRLQGYRIAISVEIKRNLRDLFLSEAWSEVEATGALTKLGETNLNATDAAILARQQIRTPEGTEPPSSADRDLLRRSMLTGIQDSVQFGK